MTEKKLKNLLKYSNVLEFLRETCLVLVFLFVFQKCGDFFNASSNDLFCVVPVFVNTGAAILPAIIGAITSIVSIIFNPRKLFEICRTKPYLPIAFIFLFGTVYFAFTIFYKNPEKKSLNKQTHIFQQRTPEQWLALAKELAKNETSISENISESSDKIIMEEIRKLNLKLDAILSGNIAIANIPAEENEKSNSYLNKQEKDLQFRVNFQRTGYIGGDSPTNLSLKWNFHEDGLMYWSSPIVYNNRVYAAWCYLDPPGSYGGIQCFDANSGNKIWEIDKKTDGTEFKGFFSSSALTADGKYLLIGQGLHPDYDCELICIDTEKAQIKWLVKVPLHIESSPAIHEDIVVVGAGAVEDAITHTPKEHSDPEKDRNPGFVMAVRISTGELIWKTVVNDPESSPAISDSKVFIGSGFNGNAVVCLDLETGKIEWQTSIPSPGTGAVTIYNDLVLIGCGNSDYVFQAKNPVGYVIALDKRTGNILWQHLTADAVLAPIAVNMDIAIVPVRNGEILALNLNAPSDDKRIIWAQKIRDKSNLLAGTAFDGKVIYGITHDGYLFVLNASDGKIIEQHFINSTPGEMGICLASPIISDGKLFVGSETGGIRCYVSKKDKQ